MYTYIVNPRLVLRTKSAGSLLAFVFPLSLLRTFSIAILILASLSTRSQQVLSDGAALLFKDVKTKLTDAQKEQVFLLTGFLVSLDKSQFIQDADSKDFPFDAQVFPTDMNNDGKEEIFILFGNTYTSGNTGSSILLYIQNSNKQFKTNLGFPGGSPQVLQSKKTGYPDLLIPGPGFEYPVWGWNGKEYAHVKNIKDEDLSKMKTTSADELSKSYRQSWR